MWIKSEDGKLFNLDGAYSVQIEDRGNSEFVVLAEYEPANERSYNLTQRTSREAAQRVLDEIEAALSRGESLLNLSREDG